MSRVHSRDRPRTCQGGRPQLHLLLVRVSRLCAISIAMLGGTRTCSCAPAAGPAAATVGATRSAIARTMPVATGALMMSTAVQLHAVEAGGILKADERAAQNCPVNKSASVPPMACDRSIGSCCNEPAGSHCSYPPNEPSCINGSWAPGHWGARVLRQATGPTAARVGCHSKAAAICPTA